MNTRALVTTLLVALLGCPLFAAELKIPTSVVAGNDFAITLADSQGGTFYLLGPSQVSKREVQGGSEINISGDSIRSAGIYTALLCSSSGCSSSEFHVKPAAPARLSLLVHPSRVRVAEPNSISAVALVFDKFRNLATEPAKIEFEAVAGGSQPISQSRTTKDGIAWIRLTSGKKEGPIKVGASIGPAREMRVVRQVASDACNLRIKPEWASGKFYVSTDPVRDCSGNPVPDGTVVSFTKTDRNGKTTVDAPVKRGIARVQMPVDGSARIFVASGVVTGNELNVTGKE
jgi:hypothetical protein